MLAENVLSAMDASVEVAWLLRAACAASAAQLAGAAAAPLVDGYTAALTELFAGEPAPDRPELLTAAQARALNGAAHVLHATAALSAEPWLDGPGAAQFDAARAALLAAAHHALAAAAQTARGLIDPAWAVR